MKKCREEQKLTNNCILDIRMLKNKKVSDKNYQ